MNQIVKSSQNKSPTNIFDYKISLNNLNDILICVLEYSNHIYESRISQSDLKSGLVNLTKLQKIIVELLKPDNFFIIFD